MSLISITLLIKGFHYFEKVQHCFNYYEFLPTNRVFEIEDHGITINDGDKSCTNNIILIRELTWSEVLVLANDGVKNTGHSNSGNRNSGDWNSGAFCTDTNPVLLLFNKPCRMTVKAWESHPACQLMYSIEPTVWVPISLMNDEEKSDHPKYETTGGYLKNITMKEAWADFWHKLTDDKKKLFTNLENFDKKIFEEITGIKIK